MKKLDVIFCGWGEEWPLGTLAQGDQGDRQVLFEYSPQAVQRGIKFSELHLPLGTRTFSKFPAHFGGIPGFIADALPDGWGLLLMDRVFRATGHDPSSLTTLDRLGFIADRAMGALAFKPSGEWVLTQESLTLQELAVAASQVVNDRDTKSLETLALLGGSPHGARPKALVQFHPASRIVSTAPDGPGQPWLVKFPAQNEHIEVCGIEHAYAQLARSVGIDMPPTQLFSISPKLAAFGIERFDRLNGMRVPVQSFAAALNADFRLPSLDYQAILQATRYLTASQPEVRKAYQRCVFNVVFNYKDDHAKNFALRMNAHFAWQLAPAYDLSFNPGPAGYHQTSVIGEAKQPARAHLLGLAKACDLALPFARSTIEKLCDAAQQLEAWLDEAGVRRSTCKNIVGAVAQNVLRCGGKR